MSDRIEKEQQIQQKNIEQPQIQRDKKSEQVPKQSFPQNREQQNKQQQRQNPLQQDHLILGRYKLGKEIGRGASGIVYGVQDELGNDIKDLALKTIKMDQMDQKQRTYVQDEIDLLKKNQNKYVVKLYGTEYNKVKEQLYIIMEKCESDLQEIYWNDIKSDQQRTKYACDLIKGVAFIHSQRICHRDLKLQNILLKGNEIKIADFGISKRMEKPMKTFVGTKQYMAPELYKKSVYTQKIDSWALGVILLELFCRKRINQLCQRYAGTQQQKQFPSDALLNEVKNKFIRKIIKNFLEKDEDKRWSIIEVAEKIANKQNKGKKIEQSQQEQTYIQEETRQPIQIQI